MSTDPATPVVVQAWLDANRELLAAGKAAPVLDSELKVLVVAGRGQRRDYHVNSVAELFYQLEGDIGVIVREDDGTVHDVVVPQGGLWLAPAGVAHSPQRRVGTVGLVVERARDAGSMEAFRWFCESCGAIVHEIERPVVDPAELRNTMLAFYANEAARRCRACGEVLQPPDS